MGTINKPIRLDQGYSPIETVIYHIDSGLTRMGYRSIVACSADSVVAGEKYATLPYSLGDYSFGNTLEQQNCVQDHLTQVTQRVSWGDVDIVHLHEWGEFVFDGTFNPQVPVVVTLHVPAQYSCFKNVQTKAGINSSVFFNCISEYQKKDYSHMLRSYKVIHHGIDVESFPAPSDATEKDYLFMIGRISREKGQDRAIEIARHTGSQLIIAGCVQDKVADQIFFHSMEDSFDLIVDAGKDSPILDYERSVIKPIVESGKQIVYVGELNTAQKKLWYKHAKATLFPIQWGEPFGLVAIESLACGTPVVAMNKGALPEIVTHGETGFVVYSLNEMMQSVGHVAEINLERCRSRAQKYFSAQRMARDYADLYHEVLAHNHITDQFCKTIQ